MDKEYLEGLYRITKKQFDGDATWNDVLDYELNHGVATTYDGVQKGARTLYTFLRGGWKLVPPDTDELNTQEEINSRMPNIAYNASDNAYTYSKVFAIAKGANLTKEDVMEKHGLDMNEWDVISFTSNYWSTQGRDEYGYPLVCYQTKITVRPKTQKELTFNDIKSWFDNHDLKSRAKVEPFPYNDSDEYLEIDLTDSHVGLLSYRQETDENYDVAIATGRVRSLFDDILERCKGKKFKKIVLATLGDILHVDNSQNTTSHGTPQDTEGRITKWYGEALQMMMDCIDKLLKLGSPIEYIYLCGNHDTSTGAMLAMSLKAIYKNNPNIYFDVRPMPQKAVVYGKTLVGLCHGDMPQKNLSSWLMSDYKKEFGRTKFAQIHCGHLHEYAVKAENGVQIYHLPSTCSASYWERKEGYRADRGMMAFVYNENTGLRNTWYSYL